MVRCGDPLSGSVMTVTEPLIIVEVRISSTAALAAGKNLAGYMGIPTLRHSLIVTIENRRFPGTSRRWNGRG
jgi:hypothetical protein